MWTPFFRRKCHDDPGSSANKMNEQAFCLYAHDHKVRANFTGITARATTVSQWERVSFDCMRPAHPDTAISTSMAFFGQKKYVWSRRNPRPCY